MEKINLNKILNREKIANEIKELLINFDQNRNDVNMKNGIYIYGNPGTGKTFFIMNILKEMNYDIIKFDAGDIRNTSVIDDITKHNMSRQNVLSMFNKNKKKKVIVMDEIDGMNNGDKGGINSLIKLIRPKKTKKQKKESVSLNPIICISNYKFDKKIKELVKVCNSFELKTPVVSQIVDILRNTMQMEIIPSNIVYYIQGDLRRLTNLIKIYKKNPDFLYNTQLIEQKNYNEDTKKTTGTLFDNHFSLDQHASLINETDRTSIALLWHENIIDVLEKIPITHSLPFYLLQLKNICFADYIDRITFQNQIWQFNEMSSLIKTFYNNYLFHLFKEEQNITKRITNVRFTKVLTKYSTEYNNLQFIQKLCQKLNMDKKDLIGYFYKLKSDNIYDDVNYLIEKYEIGKLEINRIYRYIEKYTQENAIGTSETIIDQDEDYELDNL
jgi:DNA polymerase III delta prime subunit